MRVGVFDSGLGGLTVVKSISDIFRGTDIFYIADTSHAPYGLKNKEEILNRCIKITDFLIKEHQIDALVVACNTATSAAINELREKYKNLILVGTEPGIKPAIHLTKTKSIGVLATSATLEGQKYQELINILSKEKEINLFECACVGLVEQIENAKVNDDKTYNMLEKWLEPMKNSKVDTIVLGCTHYPLVSHIIEEIMGKQINLIETGNAIANRLKDLSIGIKHVNEGLIKLDICHTGIINKEMIKIIFKNSKIDGEIMIRNCEI